MQTCFTIVHFDKYLQIFAPLLRLLCTSLLVLALSPSQGPPEFSSTGHTCPAPTNCYFFSKTHNDERRLSPFPPACLRHAEGDELLRVLYGVCPKRALSLSLYLRPFRALTIGQGICSALANARGAWKGRTMTCFAFFSGLSFFQGGAWR